MKSSALTGTPSDQTAAGFTTYWMVSGLTAVTLVLLRRSALRVVVRLGRMVYALGRTDDSRVGVEELAPLGVFGLKPSQGWSRLTLAVPPVPETRSEMLCWVTSRIRWDPRWSTIATMTMITMISRGNVQRARRSAQNVSMRLRRPP